MSPLVDFLTPNRWYRAGIHSEDLEFGDCMLQTHVGGYVRPDLGGRHKYGEGSINIIGRGWYSEGLSPIGGFEVDKLLSKAGECDDWIPKASCSSPSQSKHTGSSQPRRPIPEFKANRASAQDLLQSVPGANLESLVTARIDVVPYDYMFAYANELEVAVVNDDCRDSMVASEIVDDDGDTVTGHNSLTTPYYEAQSSPTALVYDLADITKALAPRNAFTRSEIPATITDSDNHHLCLKDTGVAALLGSDSEPDKEEIQATGIFFNHPVEESATNDNTCSIQEESGCIDAQKGYEHTSMQWPEFERKSGHIASGNRKGVLSNSDDDALSIPESTVSGATTNSCYRDDHALDGIVGLINLLQEAGGGGVVDVFDVDDDDDEYSSGQSSTTTKRRARSFLSIQSISDHGDEDTAVKFINAKKARFAREDKNDEDFGVGHASAYTFVSQPDDTAESFKDHPGPSFLAQVSEVGHFQGQFHCLPTFEQAERARMYHSQKVPVYMGRALHLNNLILHKDIHVCPEYGTTEYSFQTAPPDSEIGRCINHGSEKTFEAAGIKRTIPEEILRTEAHRECAAARLDGEVIGVYRYFQGSLTVEEYHERKMCICWQLCECSKLCTRFADMICPCAGKIETNCH